jgi:hypothetical protein
MNNLKSLISLTRMLLIFIGIVFMAFELTGQDWKYIKERKGIKLYTRKGKNSSFKPFKGETDIFSNMEELTRIILDVENSSDWDESIKEIKLLEEKPGKMIRYYVSYNVRWPFNDRDLCVEAKVIDDTISGSRTVKALPVPGMLPEIEGVERIKNYYQNWTLVPKTSDTIHVILEGMVDPGGGVPAWLVNMVVLNTPFNIIYNLREQAKDH